MVELTANQLWIPTFLSAQHTGRWSGNQKEKSFTAENAKDAEGRDFEFYALLCLKVVAARANVPVTLSHSNTGNNSRQACPKQSRRDAKHAKFGRGR